MLRQDRLSAPRSGEISRIAACWLANYCYPRLAILNSWLQRSGGQRIGLSPPPGPGTRPPTGYSPSFPRRPPLHPNGAWLECTPGMQCCRLTVSTGWNGCHGPRLVAEATALCGGDPRTGEPKPHPRTGFAQAPPSLPPANRTYAMQPGKCEFCWTAHHRRCTTAVAQQSDGHLA
jgi:hypothetical protein